MKKSRELISAAVQVTVLAAVPPRIAASDFAQADRYAHVSNTFQFLLHLPLSQAAPLFGPEGERCWAGKHWDPRFLFPRPAKDIEGAVFTVQHGPHNSVWVNTAFDQPGGRMQYVAFIPEAMISTVDVRLAAVDGAATRVTVTYVRTALDPSANGDVEAKGKDDSTSGPDWQRAIEACLKK